MKECCELACSKMMGLLTATPLVRRVLAHSEGKLQIAGMELVDIKLPDGARVVGSPFNALCLESWKVCLPNLLRWGS